MLQTKVVESYCISLEALGRANRTIEANKERLEGLQKFLIKRGVVEIENIDPELLDAYISSSYRNRMSRVQAPSATQNPSSEGFFL